MSKLIQRLEQVGKSVPAPLGFGVATRQQPAPSFVVIASTAVESRASTVDGAHADAVLFTPDTVDIEALAAVAASLGEITWGVRLQSGDRASVESLREKGCDFIAFLPSGVDLDALQDEELGRLLVVTPDMDKEQAHILEDLPMDAALFAQAPPKRLTLEALLELAAHRNQFGRFFLLPVTDAPSSWELECLRNIGVEGLVLNLDQAEAGALGALHERIVELPKPKPRNERHVALLPQMSLHGEGHGGQEEEDDDEEM